MIDWAKAEQAFMRATGVPEPVMLQPRRRHRSWAAPQQLSIPAVASLPERLARLRAADPAVEVILSTELVHG